MKIIRKVHIRLSSATKRSALLVISLLTVLTTACSHKDPAVKEVHQKVRILAINDFHGQITAGRKVNGRPAGSAPVLAAYLKNAAQGMENNTFIVHAGDLVGSSPPESSLLQDEPTIQFFNLLGNQYCRHENPMHERCNLVGTVGNHEFDEGLDELIRLYEGGNHLDGPFLEDPWEGATFPHVCANVVDEYGRPVLPPFVIKTVKHTRIAFIGAVLKETNTIVTASGVAGLCFIDETEAVNEQVARLKGMGVETIIVVIHQGGTQDLTTGEVSGDIVSIVKALDSEVDVVVTGHWHKYTNTLITNDEGADILITQSWAKGTAFAEIDLVIDRSSGDVISKTAEIITAWADEGPGVEPNLQVGRLVEDAMAFTEPMTGEVIGYAVDLINRSQNDAGESALGNLIADVQRATMATDFAFMNPGGIRNDLDGGEITWGELYEVQPFNNYLITMELTGQQIYDLLNQQFAPYQPYDRILQVSGLTYTWDGNGPVNDLVVEVRKDGVPIDRNATYSVAVNSFIAEGGDLFTVLLDGVNQQVGPIDLDALIRYIQSSGQPVNGRIDGRIERVQN